MTSQLRFSAIMAALNIFSGALAPRALAASAVAAKAHPKPGATVVPSPAGTPVTTGAPTTTEEDFFGTAVNVEGKTVYVEHHHVVYVGNDIRLMETTYTNPQGKAIATMRSRYSFGPRIPETDFEDLRTGIANGARISEGHVELWNRPLHSDFEKTRSFTLTDNSLVGQGFHQTLRLNLKELAAGEVLRFKLFLPVRLTSFAFMVSKVELKDNLLRIRMESENWIVRLLAPKIEATYDLKTSRILVYQGPSNVEDDDGNTQLVTLRFEYPKANSTTP